MNTFAGAAANSGSGENRNAPHLSPHARARETYPLTLKARQGPLRNTVKLHPTGVAEPPSMCTHVCTCLHVEARVCAHAHTDPHVSVCISVLDYMF